MPGQSITTPGLAPTQNYYTLKNIISWTYLILGIWRYSKKIIQTLCYLVTFYRKSTLDLIRNKIRHGKPFIYIVFIKYWIQFWLLCEFDDLRELIIWERESVIALQRSRKWRWKLQEWHKPYREVNGPVIIYWKTRGTQFCGGFFFFSLISIGCGNTTQSLLNSL